MDSAQKAEVRLAETALGTMRVSRPRGRPRQRSRELIGDKGYDSKELRERLRKRGIHAYIQERRGKRPRPARKSGTSGDRHRWVAERTFARLGNFRRLVVRYERLLLVYHAFFILACILIWLKRLLQ